MPVSKKKHDFLFDRYGQSASCVDLLEHQLVDLDDVLKKNGGPYKYVLECHEAAMALSSSGREPTWQTLERLVFIDRQTNGLPPALTRQVSIQEWQEMLDICSADHAYGMPRHQSQRETRRNEY